MTDLNLAWNNLRTKGGKLIFNKLADNSMVSTDLSTLNVDWNGLDSTVVGSMSRWLAESQSMQHLTFSNNNIDSNGAIELATMLEDNLALEYLDASFNPLGTVGTKAIIKSLERNES